MTIKILIADDHGILRAGLRALLQTEPDLDVVGEASGGREALHLAAHLRPDVVVMDVSMPDLDGIQATRLLLDQDPRTRVLLLTVHEDVALLRKALQAGVAGYIVKRAVETELISAIHSVAAGDFYVYPFMARALLNHTTRAPASDIELDNLTTREKEVLRLVALGHTNRQIANMFKLSTRTVETHRANLMAKLGLRSRADLVRYAVDRGLLEVRNGPP